MKLDAVIIADIGQDQDGVPRPGALTSPRLRVNGRAATLQNILGAIKGPGAEPGFNRKNGNMALWSAPKYNGIFLLSHLTEQGFRVALINKYYQEKEGFRKLLEENPRVVVISTTFIHSKESLRKLVNDIRSLAPDIFIIAGGQFVYKSYIFLQRSREKDYVVGAGPKDFLFFGHREPSVDLYIIGRQGEDILCEALRRIRAGDSLKSLPNTARQDRNGYSFTPFADVVKGHGKVHVDWGSLPDYVFRSGVMPMQASGGCFHKCAFCTFRKDGRMIFIKPVEALVDEMKAVAERGIRYVRFIDDNFRLERRDLNSFCQRVVDEGTPIQWMTMIKISALENTDLDLLRRAGCFEVALGLESRDPQILRNMNKDADPEKYEEGIERLLAAGINCSCYFLFGFPGETDETALRTRKFIRDVQHPELPGILSWNLYTLIMAPLSPVYESEMRSKYGITGYMDDWKHDTMDRRRAIAHVQEAYYELDDSGPIFKGDNLDLFCRLEPGRRKDFYITRYRLAKRAAKGDLREGEAVVEEFKKILGPVISDLAGASAQVQRRNPM